MKKIIVLAVAAVLGLAGCSATHGSAEYGNVSHSPADVIEFPEGFRNVAHKCDGPNMVYSGSSASSDSLPASVSVVKDDPRCLK